MSYYDDPTKWTDAELLIFRLGYNEGMASSIAFLRGLPHSEHPALAVGLDRTGLAQLPSPAPSRWRRVLARMGA